MHSERTVTFIIGELNFSYTDLKLTIGREVFNLTQKEADLLKFLCEHSNRILKEKRSCSMSGEKTIISWAVAWTCS